MRSILDRQYTEPQIVRYSPNTSPLALRKPGIKCVYGHCRYGLHQHTNLKPAYITILRDPLDRVLSMYYYIRSRPQNKMHHKVKHMSLKQFVTCKDPRIHTPINNHQTRLISGMRKPDLKKAKLNIKNDFAVVGITEMYPESVFMMKQALGWSSALYRKENKTRQRREKTQVPEKVKRLIQKKNALDYQLYAYARKQLLRQLQSLGPRAKQQLAVFKSHHSLGWAYPKAHPYRNTISSFLLQAVTITPFLQFVYSHFTAYKQS